MDFFGAQRSRTQRSLLLFRLFFLIVFAHIAVALGVMALLLTLFTGGIYHWVLILVAVWTIGSFVVGSFLEYRRLKAGGRAIAQRVGAVRLFIDHTTAKTLGSIAKELPISISLYLKFALVPARLPCVMSGISRLFIGVIMRLPSS
ncbi:hypothetical protein ACTXLR_01400 [Psychrobacter faecalis]|uniref:hypothetical protein n=1 Tax=Psychrobacter faecalis TaxID=180588 RepID=UPI003FD39418